jgi:hypothetical protein
MNYGPKEVMLKPMKIWTNKNKLMQESSFPPETQELLLQKNARTPTFYGFPPR